MIQLNLTKLDVIILEIVKSLTRAGGVALLLSLEVVVVARATVIAESLAAVTLAVEEPASCVHAG